MSEGFSVSLINVNLWDKNHKQNPILNKEQKEFRSICKVCLSLKFHGFSSFPTKKLQAHCRGK